MNDMIEEELLNSGRIFVIGDINKKTMTSFIFQLKYLTRKKNIDDIYVYIHSDGGTVECAMAMIDEMNLVNESGKRVHTIAYGSASSAAAFLLAYGHTRYGTENSTYMLHPIFYKVEDYHPQSKEYVRFADVFYNRIITDIALRCKKHKAKEMDTFIRKIAGSLWLDTESAIKIGLIDHKWTPELENSIDVKP